MSNLAAELQSRLGKIAEEKRERAQIAREQEFALKQEEERKLAVRTERIVELLKADLSDQNILGLIESHCKFHRVEHAKHLIIDFQNPETDYTSSNVPDSFDKATLFAVQQSPMSPRYRTPIKAIAEFSYLREVKEVHAAIRNNAIQDRLNELKANGIEIEFVQRNASPHRSAMSSYQVKLHYPSPEV